MLNGSNLPLQLVPVAGQKGVLVEMEKVGGEALGLGPGEREVAGAAGGWSWAGVGLLGFELFFDRRLNPLVDRDVFPVGSLLDAGIIVECDLRIDDHSLIHERADDAQAGRWNGSLSVFGQPAVNGAFADAAMVRKPGPVLVDSFQPAFNDGWCCCGVMHGDK